LAGKQQYKGVSESKLEDLIGADEVKARCISYEKERINIEISGQRGSHTAERLNARLLCYLPRVVGNPIVGSIRMAMQ
jgi:hypothetical protein